MGDVADMHLSGFLCHTCGTVLDGEETGHPRWCEECGRDEGIDESLIVEECDG